MAASTCDRGQKYDSEELAWISKLISVLHSGYATKLPKPLETHIFCPGQYWLFGLNCVVVFDKRRSIRVTGVGKPPTWVSPG
jgi:hypothetical protein